MHQHGIFHKNCQTVAEILQYFYMVIACHIGLVLCVWTTQREYLVVFICLQNLLRIDSVVFHNMKVWIFCAFGWNHLFAPQKFWFWGYDSPNKEAVSIRPAEVTPYTETCHVAYKPSINQVNWCGLVMSRRIEQGWLFTKTTHIVAATPVFARLVIPVT